MTGAVVGEEDFTFTEAVEDLKYDPDDVIGSDEDLIDGLDNVTGAVVEYVGVELGVTADVTDTADAVCVKYFEVG